MGTATRYRIGGGGVVTLRFGGMACFWVGTRVTDGFVGGGCHRVPVRTGLSRNDGGCPDSASFTIMQFTPKRPWMAASHYKDKINA